MLVRDVVDGSYPMKVVNGLSRDSIVIGKLQLMGCGSRGFLFYTEASKIKNPPSIRYHTLMPGLDGGT